jgi:hypothetical protein
LNPWKRTLSAIVVVLAVTTPTVARDALTPPPSPFAPIAAVLLHPRCLNCHSVGEAARNSEAQLRHARRAAAAAQLQGVARLPCTSCHHGTNSADGGVPGGRNWRAAPASMGWDGLSPRQICQAIKDPAKNGNRRTPDAVIEHMKVAPLVLWSWNPGGGRTAPAVSHDEFVRELQAWAAAGAPCPSDAPL